MKKMDELQENALRGSVQGTEKILLKNWKNKE